MNAINPLHSRGSTLTSKNLAFAFVAKALHSQRLMNQAFVIMTTSLCLQRRKDTQSELSFLHDHAYHLAIAIKEYFLLCICGQGPAFVKKALCTRYQLCTSWICMVLNFLNKPSKFVRNPIETNHICYHLFLTFWTRWRCRIFKRIFFQ